MVDKAHLAYLRVMTDYANNALSKNGVKVTEFDIAHQMGLQAARKVDPKWTHPLGTATALYNRKYGAKGGFDV